MSVPLLSDSRVAAAALAVLLSFIPSRLPAQAHTSEAPGMLEGPQTPGAPAPERAPSPTLMNNDSVLRMVLAGLGQDLIVQTINTQPGAYAVDPDSLIALKAAKVPDAIIAAMVSPARRSLRPQPAPIVLAEVNEPGVYYKNREGQWTLMESEIVHIKSGGFIKSTVTYGIIKQDRNGVIHGMQAKLLLPRPIEFLIYTPEGVAGDEYDLLQFRLNGKDREFRTFTGGIIHSSGGAERDEIPFHAVRTAPHTYTFKVGMDVPGGEFGILPPGSGNITNGGKIYTFAITE